MTRFFKILVAWGQRRIIDLKKSNSGEWTWLAAKPISIASLNRHLWRGADPSLNYYVLLFLSAVIATLGLIANSSATIIGAMIVAPLMGPIIGIAFSMVVANRRLLKRASLALATGVLLNIGTAAVITAIVGLEITSAEINARVSPTLIDLGVALAAGAAGAFAKSKRGIADALPGVAIAVALVPPLSVIGIGIATQSQPVTTGASLLFSTNLAGIIFSSGVIFLWQRYGSIARAQQGLIIAIATLLILGIPLGLSFQDLVIRERTRLEITRLIRRQTLTFGDRDIRTLNVTRQGNQLQVEMEVAALANSISQNQVDLVQDFLEQALESSISLRVTVLPIERFESNP